MSSRTNHFNRKDVNILTPLLSLTDIIFEANAPIFRDHQFWDVVLSNLGIGSMALLTLSICNYIGFGTVVKYYGIPWLLVTHWFVMITYVRCSLTFSCAIVADENVVTASSHNPVHSAL